MLLLVPQCYSADFVFVQPPGNSPAEQKQLQIATKFYGLNLRLITATSPSDSSVIAALIERHDTAGVAVAATALPMLNQNLLLRALRTKRGASESLYIIGVSSTVSGTTLKSWSGGAVYGCKPLPATGSLQISFGPAATITREMSGVAFPFTADEEYYLLSHRTDPALMQIRGEQRAYPVFMETSVDNVAVFLSCATRWNNTPVGDGDVVDAFLRVAPEMLFVRYCCGERGWHSPYQYANLTIDDPWLRQPYGYLNYRGLLAQMNAHNFHTTIAFIPWNYADSEPAVVKLFRNHPDRFSITIHGNNHDHKEFMNYRGKPYPVQVADLKQSLARMQKFEQLTGIPFDKVMVFPHSIAPEKTLSALKTYNYIATVNSRNVPEGATEPGGISFDLRPVTLLFGGFPSLIRYSVAVPVSPALIAVQEFLGNPLLFYCHSEFFAEGIGAFDGIADDVNRLDPHTRWTSLGEIVKHLYVIKQRSDLNYDVLSFSSNICVENSTGRDALFYVHKQEFGGQLIASVTSNDSAYDYQLHGDDLAFTLPIANAKSRCVDIKYRNNLDLASIGIAHSSIIVYLLRKGSDFRDIYLSKAPGGLAFISFYDRHHFEPAETIGFILVILLIFLFIVYRLRVSLAARQSAERDARFSDDAVR